MKIIGYYTDYNIHGNFSEELKAIDVFVAIEQLENGKLLIFCPHEGHSEIDPEYLNACVPIAKEYYKKVSKVWYTPNIYL